MCVCYPSGMIDIEAKTPCGTYSYVDESCICGHHVSKDFCIPVINEVCSGNQGKFWAKNLVAIFKPGVCWPKAGACLVS